ncbi:hypothetical protein FQA39_LY11422 [Lamprigera yunnana]|nr:hypothetical protein FQA39_LY11422 [Lamprigera yunnana]
MGIFEEDKSVYFCGYWIRNVGANEEKYGYGKSLQKFGEVASVELNVNDESEILMAPPKLYVIDISPQVRSVLLTAKAIGLTLNYEIVSYNTPEEIASVFIKKISHHSLPILVDNGYIIWDSQAIIAFLIGKYANDDSLYPRDHIKRTIIDQRINFNVDVVLANLSFIVRRVVKSGVSHIPTDIADNLKEAYNFLEEFLQDQKWMACNHLTIADFYFIPTVTSADILIPIDAIKYPNICSWLKRCQELSYYKEANQIGLDNFKTVIRRIVK